MSPWGSGCIHKIHPLPWACCRLNIMGLSIRSTSFHDTWAKGHARGYYCSLLPPPKFQSFNLDGILIEKLQEVARGTYLILVGDFNAPNVNWKDMTTSSHESTFDAWFLSFCLDNFLVQHSILAILGQRENCPDLVFTKLPEDILSFNRGPQLGNTDHLSLCFDYVCFTCPNPNENRKRNLWKGDFEGMIHHLQATFKIGTRCQLAILKQSG